MEIKYVGGMWVCVSIEGKEYMIHVREITSWCLDVKRVEDNMDRKSQQHETESKYEEDDYSVDDEGGVNLDQFFHKTMGMKILENMMGLKKGLWKTRHYHKLIKQLEDAHESHDDAGNNIKTTYTWMVTKMKYI